jgi:two-component system chemotaxis response regulator CheY
MKVLVVDDHNAMRDMLRGLLNQIGYADVEEAEGVEQALGMLASSDYDLIVSDWGMRPKAGLAFLRAVRADERTRHTPVVMVASDGGSEDVERIDAAESLIFKPFNAATLRAKIHHALGAHPK